MVLQKMTSLVHVGVIDDGRPVDRLTRSVNSQVGVDFGGMPRPGVPIHRVVSDGLAIFVITFDNKHVFAGKSNVLFSRFLIVVTLGNRHQTILACGAHSTYKVGVTPILDGRSGQGLSRVDINGTDAVIIVDAVDDDRGDVGHPHDVIAVDIICGLGFLVGGQVVAAQDVGSVGQWWQCLLDIVLVEGDDALYRHGILLGQFQHR